MMEDYVLQDELRKRALKLLDYRPMSRRELIDKLVQKGEEKEAAAEAVDWLIEVGLLNEGIYAEQVIRHYAAKGYGKHRIEQELWRRGVAKELWDGAFQEMPDGDDAIDRFIQSKLRGEAPDQREEKRVVDALCRRGYSWDEINQAMRRYKDSLDS